MVIYLCKIVCCSQSNRMTGTAGKNLYVARNPWFYQWKHFDMMIDLDCLMNGVKFSNFVQRRIPDPVKHLRWSFFVKIVNDIQQLTILGKSSILDVLRSWSQKVVSLKSLNDNEETITITHSFPVHPFSTPWKHKKTLRFSEVFRR